MAGDAVSRGPGQAASPSAVTNVLGPAGRRLRWRRRRPGSRRRPARAPCAPDRLRRRSGAGAGRALRATRRTGRCSRAGPAQASGGFAWRAPGSGAGGTSPVSRTSMHVAELHANLWNHYNNEAFASGFPHRGGRGLRNAAIWLMHNENRPRARRGATAPRPGVRMGRKPDEALIPREKIPRPGRITRVPWRARASRRRPRAPSAQASRAADRGRGSCRNGG